MRTISIVIRRPPYGSLNTEEALRLAVGCTIGDHSVNLIFIGEGVYSILPDQKSALISQKEIYKDIELLKMTNASFYVYEKDLMKRKIEEVPSFFNKVDLAEIDRIIAKSDFVWAW
ncbi:MAG: DsrE family protein [Candidatus Hydrothermarchaeota archaeon]